MKLILASGLCGMSPRQGSIVGGLYYIMIGIMQVTFEFGHLRIASEKTKTTGELLLSPVSFIYYYSMLAMEGSTLILSVVLLVALFSKRYVIILGFAVYLVLFDVGLVVILSLLEIEMKAVGLELSPLSWYGIVCRLVGDPFWLTFVITHGLEQHAKKLRPGQRQNKSLGPKGEKEEAEVKLKFKVFDSDV
ncbi:transmembrane protein 217-like [Aplochiton taeniatus]